MQLRTLAKKIGTTLPAAATYGALELTRSKARTELTTDEVKKVKLGYIKNRAKAIGESFLSVPYVEFGNRTPTEMLKDGEIDSVVELVKKLDEST